MPPRLQATPFPPLFLFLFLTFLIPHLPTLTPSHDAPLTLIYRTSENTYNTQISRNPHANRCALLLCTSDPPPETACDHLKLTLDKNSTKSAPALCPLDYLSSNWDALSRTYNEGIFYVSPRVHLRGSPESLPRQGKRVHIPYARKPPDISPIWFALTPSNVTKRVVKEWAQEAEKISDKGNMAVHLALNKVRGCRATDVMCHGRDASIRMACDNVGDIRACVAGGGQEKWLRAALIAGGIMWAVRIMIGGLIGERGRNWGGLRKWTGIGLEKWCIGVILMVLGGVGVGCLLAMLRWSDCLEVLGRLVVVKVIRKLDGERVEGGLSFGGEVMGGWDKYAFIVADGVERIVVSGPGAGFVVWLFGGVRSLGDAVGDGLLVWEALFLIAVWGGVRMLKLVAGGKKKDVEEDEYADRREATWFRRRERGRSFVMPKEREKVQAV